MGTFRFETVDVFTTERFGGNPLAVFPDAAGLPETAMQRIAREFNLSETTFVFPPEDAAHTARVRIFTPKHELPFAGHPNVGTALVLAARRDRWPERMVFEEAAGLAEITFDLSGPHPRAAVEAPVPLAVGAAVPAALVAGCTGLATADILLGTHAPVVAGTGVPFVVAEVAPAALARAVPDVGAIAAAAADGAVGALGFPILLHAGQAAGRRVRMFAPLSGIPEDAATGAANLGLVALLLSLGTAPHLRLTVEQGVEMGRPSVLHAEAWRTAAGIRARIGGSAVPVTSGLLTV